MPQNQYGFDNINLGENPDLSRLLNRALELAGLSSEVLGSHSSAHVDMYYLFKGELLSQRPWSFSQYEMNLDWFESADFGTTNPYRGFNLCFKYIDQPTINIAHIWYVNRQTINPLVFSSSNQAFKAGYLYTPGVDGAPAYYSKDGVTFFWMYPYLHVNEDLSQVIAGVNVPEADMPSNVLLYLTYKMAVYMCNDKSKFQKGLSLERQIQPIFFDCNRREDNNNIIPGDNYVDNYNIFRKARGNLR